MDEGTGDPYAVGAAEERELSRLLEIEDRAGRRYGDLGMDPDGAGLSLDELREGLSSRTLWIARTQSGRPVGFALGWVRPGALHLREIDVVPEHGRRGLGGRLLRCVARRARALDLPWVTLTTFAEVPWNAPYYIRHGFLKLPRQAWPTWLTRLRADEEAQGLDRWPRVVMAKAVAV